MSRETIRHPTRPEISVTVKAAPREVLQLAIVQAGRSIRHAGWNLLCNEKVRVAPAVGSEAQQMMNRWPKLASIVYRRVMLLCGALDMEQPGESELLAQLPDGPAKAQFTSRYTAWRMDLSALWTAAQRMRELEESVDTESVIREQLALHAAHDTDLAALEAAGIPDRLKNLAAAHATGDVIAVRSAEHGVFLLWNPGFDAAMEWDNREMSKPLDAWDALVMASVMADPSGEPVPDEVTMSKLMAHHPALSVSLGTLAKDLWGEDLQEEIKKE